MRLIRRDDDAVIAEQVETARRLVRRIVGLIGRREFPPGCALVIPRCRQVHTFFMRFPIDVVFLDEDNRVLRAESDVKPYGITGRCRGGFAVVELPAGTVARFGICPGDEMMMSEGT